MLANAIEVHDGLVGKKLDVGDEGGYAAEYFDIL